MAIEPSRGFLAVRVSRRRLKDDAFCTINRSVSLVPVQNEKPFHSRVPSHFSIYRRLTNGQSGLTRAGGVWKALVQVSPDQLTSRGSRSPESQEAIHGGNCPVCGGAELVYETLEIPCAVKGESTTIPEVSGKLCPACREAVLERKELARVSSLMLELNKQVNASIVDPAFIARVREEFALDHREAGEIFGGDVKSFSRCEKGRTKLPPVLVKPLNVLDRHTFTASPTGLLHGKEAQL